ncbi:hypothetical protein [Flavobacterium sp.]|uniref:hypothetical protein n=1 Tax=Flavobacterium sp. TaxID=239 RepID=UPI002633199B|nr:hypothetical protein [Flavobacterium sp.]
MKSLKPKFILSLLFFVLISTCFTSCHVHHPRHRTVVVKHKHLPPGHAKKISGDKSARRHAPGHRR